MHTCLSDLRPAYFYRVDSTRRSWCLAVPPCFDLSGIDGWRQVGLASDKAQYIHRLGRTARAGKSGKGMLLLGDFEERFLGSLQELPLARAAPLPGSALAEAGALVQRGLMQVDDEDKAQVIKLKAVSRVSETRHTTPQLVHA